MGTLLIVATPIGNLKDVSFRAIEVLKFVDYILCEDTRVTGKLLNHFEIQKKMVTFNDFNEESKKKSVLEDLGKGVNIALVSDAGTPLVSDPGFKLVREAIQEGIRVESIPGPSSVIAALTVSGLPTDKFTFVGYLPKKEGKKIEILRNLKVSRGLVKSTLIIFESPYRVVNTLESIKGVFGDIDVVVCRELTKMHEEVLRGKISNSIELIQSKPIKGEFVILY